MTAIKETAGSVAGERRGTHVLSYIAAGLVAVAIGIGIGWASVSVVGSSVETANLQGRIEAGMAQQAAIQDAAQLQARVEGGLAQQAALAEAAKLQGRVEAGLAQAAAIESANAFESAWNLRASAVPSHLEQLVTSGLAQQSAANGS